MAASPPRRSLEFLTPNTMSKRMGSAVSDPVESVNRMDLGSTDAERLSAQVKAISLLSTVRNMQDEIKDINDQIEKGRISLMKMK